MTSNEPLDSPQGASDPHDEKAIEGEQIDALIAALAQGRATIAAMQAAEATMLATVQLIGERRIARGGVGSSDADMPLREVAADIASALRVSDRTVQRQMAESADLAVRFPLTLRALSEGRISRAHVIVITTAGAHIDDPEERADYEASVLEYAERESASRLKPVATVRAEKAQRRPLAQRHREAAKARGVWIRDLPDGMAELIATLPAALAHGILDRLGQMAVAVETDPETGQTDPETDQVGEHDDIGSPRVPRAGDDGERAPERDAGGVIDESTPPSEAAPTTRDERGMDELRADILTDLLLAAAPAGHHSETGLAAIRGHVQLTVPVLSLLGRGSDAPATPADLHGYGPVDPETAATLTAGCPGWDRVLTHPVTGAVLAVDRYRPGEDLKRTLRVRDRHCRFPGCRQPARRCDIDHTVDAQFDGATEMGNLAHLCRRHHSLKHATAWTVKQRPGGVLEWTSPTGRVHPDIPTGVAFEPDPPPF